MCIMNGRPLSSPQARVTSPHVESCVAVAAVARQMTRAEATRRRLLDASLVVFGRKGVHETRVDDICAATGVARATFYRHFDGKAAVFEALHSEMAAEMLRIAGNLEPVGPDVAGLQTIREFVAGMLAASERWAPVVSALSGGNQMGLEIREQSIGLTEEFSRAVGLKLVEGAVADVNPSIAAVAIIALVDGVGNQLRTWSPDLDRGEVIDLLAIEILMMLHPGLDIRDLQPVAVTG